MIPRRLFREAGFLFFDSAGHWQIPEPVVCGSCSAGVPTGGPEEPIGDGNIAATRLHLSKPSNFIVARRHFSARLSSGLHTARELVPFVEETQRTGAREYYLQNASKTIGRLYADDRRPGADGEFGLWHVGLCGSGEDLFAAEAERLETPDRSGPILLLHSQRHLGLMFLASGAVYPGLPVQFAWPAAIGDFIAALLAFLAIPLTLRDFQSAKAVLWVFSIFGVLDLVIAILLANLFEARFYMGAAYWIPSFWVPALLVTHYIAFRILAGDRACGARNGSPLRETASR